MTKGSELFYQIGSEIADSGQSQMFGKPCFKINGKAFICYFENAMVFKLDGDILTEALGLTGSKSFDPSGKNRPMKSWVQVPDIHIASWKKFAEAAAKFVADNNP